MAGSPAGAGDSWDFQEESQKGGGPKGQSRAVPAGHPELWLCLPPSKGALRHSRAWSSPHTLQGAWNRDCPSWLQL